MESQDLATSITRLSLNRRVSMFVLFLTILAVGLIAVSRLKLELFPKGFENLLLEHVQQNYEANGVPRKLQGWGQRSLQ